MILYRPSLFLTMAIKLMLNLSVLAVSLLVGIYVEKGTLSDLFLQLQTLILDGFI